MQCTAWQNSSLQSGSSWRQMQRRNSERAAVVADLAVAAALVAAAGLAACHPSQVAAACPSALAATSCSPLSTPVHCCVSCKALGQLQGWGVLLLVQRYRS